MNGIVRLIVWLLIGAIAGWLAGLIYQDAGFGLLGNIVVGIIGSFVGGFLARLIPGVPDDGNILYDILLAVVGAVVLLFILGLIF